MKYVKGNLLDLAEQGKFDIVIHGANCQNTMNSGIAKEIRERYPKAFMVDQLTQKGDLDKLGHFTQAYIDDFRLVEVSGGSRRPVHFGFTIINAYTQGYYGYDSKQYVDYEAIKQAFRQIKMLYDMNPQAPARIGIPKIGSKRGGGDWNVIERIIDDLQFSNLTCVEFSEGNDDV